MSWAGIANNQTISNNNLQDAVTTGVLCLKNTIPASTKQITKTEANNYVNLYPNYPSFAAKASNQLVVKKDLPNQIGYAATYGALAYRTFDGGYSWENISPGGSIVISSVACSSTGNYVTLLQENGNVWYSSTYGSSWSNVAFTPNASTQVAMSKDGQYQTLCRYGDYLYRSTNWGANWAQVTSAGSRKWYAIAISSTGQYQTAGDASVGGYIYRSTDYGVSYTPITGAGARYWTYMAAMSNNGEYQFIIGNDGITPPFTSQIYRSTDYGATWAAVQSSQYKRSLACSSSGQYVIAGTDGGQVWISSNYGVTWAQANLYPSGNTLWDATAISATGQYMFAGNGAGSILSYYSNDYGANWTQSSLGAVALVTAEFATESCFISTTTTSTTAIPTVDFSTSAGCANGSSSDGSGIMVSFNGGSGVYQASDTTYSTEALALAGSYTDVSTSRTFSSLAAGTYFVALRDKNDFGNKRARSFTVTVCTTTTTTTLPPITASTSSVCTTSGQNITIDTFTGGDGANYSASTITYGDAGSASAGAVTLVGGPSSSRLYTNQANGTRYVKITSGGIILVKQVGTTYDQAENWVNNGSTFCSGCIAYQPQINNNPCSSTYNSTRNLSLGATAPCNYAANWVNNGSTFCSGCIAYQPEIDNNPCSPTYNTTRNVNLGATAPCDYNANYSSAIGTYYYCSAGSVFSTTVYQNSNACYTGANIYYDAVHGATSTNYSNSSPSTAAVWIDNGSVRCESCVNQKQQTDTNQCSPTYGSTQWVNDPFGSTCNYSAVWVNRDINTYWVCVGVDKYYQQIDTNPCSSTYNTTQTGALYQVNSPDCGYAPFKYLATDCYTSTGTIYSSSNGSLNGVTIQTSTACYLLTIAVMGTAVGPLPSYTVIADCSVCGI